MTEFVLDNSVTMRWCFENAVNPYAEAVLLRLSGGGRAIVPLLWRYEVISVLAKAQRTGVIAPEKAQAFLDAVRALDIAIDDEGPHRIMTDVHRFAVACRLTGYDAAYLELALRRNLPLATLDTDLARACVAAGGTILPDDADRAV